MTIPVINRKLKNGKIRKVTVDTGERLKEIHICVQEKLPDQELSEACRSAVNIKHDEIPQVVSAMLKAAELPDDVVKFMDDTYELMDDFVVLKRMLDKVPDSSNVKEFDENLESRRRVWRKLHEKIEVIGSKMEKEWAEKLWDKVKEKGEL